MMSLYYLTPSNWSIDGYRRIATENEIEGLPSDWGASLSDCDLVGEFDTEEEATIAAKRNKSWEMDMQ